jgi:hypothetical protein
MRGLFAALALLLLCPTSSFAQVGGEPSLVALAAPAPAQAPPGISLDVPALAEPVDAMPAYAAHVKRPLPDYPAYRFQGAVGIDYSRFFVLPTNSVNMWGAHASFAYFLTPRFGLEAIAAASYGNQEPLSPTTIATFFGKSRLSSIGAGARYRFPLRYRLESFVHVDGAYVRYYSQAFDTQWSAPALIAGAGVDFRIRRRISLRAEASASGTFFWGGWQISPLVSAGTVVNF